MIQDAMKKLRQHQVARAFRATPNAATTATRDLAPEISIKELIAMAYKLKEYLTIWYVMTPKVPPGEILKAEATEFFPRLIVFHPSALNKVTAAIKESNDEYNADGTYTIKPQLVLRNYKEWRPRNMDTNLLENYIKMLEDTIDAEGVYPMLGSLEHEDGRLTLVSFATNAETMLGAIQYRCRKKPLTRALIGMDNWNKKDPTATLDDSCVIIFDITRGNANLGVLEYTWDDDCGNAIVEPVNWDNAHWKEAYKTLLVDMAAWIQ